MALSPKIQLCLLSNCSTLNLYELTGIYNASTNTGGYGAPNKSTTDIVSAILTIISPDGTNYNYDVKTLLGLPSSNPALAFQLDLSLIGNRTSIEDGYWQFIYTITDSGGLVTSVNVSYYFYCNIQCCVSKMLATIELDDCNCNNNNNKNIDRYIKTRVYLDSLINSSNCNDDTSFTNTLSLLKKLCKNQDCLSCN